MFGSGTTRVLTDSDSMKGLRQYRLELVVSTIGAQCHRLLAQWGQSRHTASLMQSLNVVGISVGGFSADVPQHLRCRLPLPEIIAYLQLGHLSGASLSSALALAMASCASSPPKGYSG